MRMFTTLLTMAFISALAVPPSTRSAQEPTAPQTSAPERTAPTTTNVPPPPEAKNVKSSSGATVPPPGERHPRYRIERSDVLELTFPIATEFNQKIRVQPDGYVSLQGAGSILLLGLTMPEATDAIKKAYAGILNDPIINVDLAEFQRPYFIVTGQVGKPGQYDLRTDITVAQAISIAGGFAPTAKTQVFLYHRDQNGWVEARELKLKDFLHGK